MLTSTSPLQLRVIACKYNPNNVNENHRFNQFPNNKFKLRSTGRLVPHIVMAEGNSVQGQSPPPVIVQERITIPNKHGEKLVGLLDDTGSRELVVICHGFQGSKEFSTVANLSTALTSFGFSAFRFDFSGNGESEGEFSYGNYWKEVEDLRAVILHFSGKEHKVNTIIGHSKGGNVVLLYASKYQDIVGTVINISGRYDLEKGIGVRLGNDFKRRINEDGFIDVMDKHGNVEYRVTKESLMDRLQIDMKSAALSISKSCRVLTIHGSKDEIIPVTDAFEFDKVIPNHSLHVIDEGNHLYSRHQNDLASVVLNFIKDG